MIHRSRRLTLALFGFSLLLGFSPLYAKATLDGLSLGTHVSGEKLTAEAIKGKIVLFETWGISCSRCHRSIGDLRKYQEKFGNDLFVVIASQCQKATEDQIKKVWSDRKGGDVITVINHGRLPGGGAGALPKCFLFDETGKLIHEGFPFGLDEKIAELVEKHPGVLVAGMDYVHLRKEAESIGKKKKSFSTVLKKLEKATTHKDPEVVEEARYILSRIEGWVEERKISIQELYENDPLQCVESLKDVIKRIGRDEKADWFKAKEKETRSSDYRKEITAFKKYEKWKKDLEKIGLLGGSPSTKALKSLSKFKKSGQTFVERYPETIASKKTSEIMVKLDRHQVE